MFGQGDVAVYIASSGSLKRAPNDNLKNCYRESSRVIKYTRMALIVYNLRGAFLGSVTPAPEQKDFRTQSTSIYQDVLTPKEFVPEGVQLTQKLELVWSTDQRLYVTSSH